MGYENFLITLIEEPTFADRFMDRITEIYIENCSNYLDQVGEYLDVFVTLTMSVVRTDGWFHRTCIVGWSSPSSAA